MDKELNKNIKNFITSVASRNSNLVTTYLFGSYAKGNPGDNSDIDLALIIRNLKDNDKFDVQVQLMLLASEFDLRIEPHPISIDDFNSNNPFVNEVKSTGLEIKPRVKVTNSVQH
jgi:predicted nucleotidyltransferase